MQLRSGRRLVYPPLEPQGGGRRGRRRRRSQHSSEDRISGLPDDLLLDILARLRSPAEAARAGAVCRGWRGLWTNLPELWFYSALPHHVEATLARITRPSLDLLFIDLWANWDDDEDWSEQVPLLLRGAARVLPKKLTIMVSRTPSTTAYAVDLPCLERTSHLSLDLMGSLPITLPQYGEFTALESLHLEWCCIDLGALLPLCPCLRILNISNLSVDTVIVHSPSLEEFVLEVHNYDISCIDIAAPVLKEVTVDVDIAKGFSLSFSAPMMKKLRWGCYFPCVCVGFSHIWCLISINEHELDDFHVVSLELMRFANDGPLGAQWSITQLIAHLPVTVFSVLELHLKTEESHSFGPILLRLLRIQPTIQRLKVVLESDKVRVPCPVDCPCEQPSNWRSEDVSLANLEVVEIHGLKGKDDEVDFLKIILRCATVLQRLTMTISNDISPSNDGYEKICSIVKEYPNVKCHVIASGSEGVLYP